MLSKILTILCFAFINTSDVYQLSVPTIEGGTQALAGFQGKKLLIVTLPLSQTPASDSLLFSLDTIAVAHANNLKVIAVPTYEDGYNPAIKVSLQSWYRSKLSNNVIITDGLYARKTSGELQHSLFKWLTNDQENGRFNMDINSPETKYFINSDGKIYGILRQQTKMGSLSLNRIINSPVQTEY